MDLAKRGLIVFRFIHPAHANLMN